MSSKDKKLLFNFIAQMDKVTLSKDRLKFPIKFQNRRHFHQSNEDHLDISSQYTKVLNKIQRRHNLDIADIEGTQSRVLPHPRKSNQKIQTKIEEEQIDKLVRKQSSNQIFFNQKKMVLKTEMPSLRQHSLPSLPILVRERRQEPKEIPPRNPQQFFIRIKTQPVEKLGKHLFSSKINDQAFTNRMKFQSQCRNPTFISNIFLI